MDKKTFFKISYGVYIVTCWVDGKPTGCVANSIMQVTSDPPTFAVSINRNNFTADCVKKSGKFAINILPETAPPALIGTFGFKSGKDVDKFEDTDYTVQAKLPVISGTCGYIVCDVKQTMETSTHTVFLGEAVAAESLSSAPPMTYDYYHKVIKGSAPKNAPTFNPEATAQAEQTVRYRCTVCGYIHEGELPDDFVCPICGVGKELFEKI